MCNVSDKFKCEDDGFYGIFTVPQEIFDSIDLGMCTISCDTEDFVKYLCNNSKEREYLESLGFEIVGNCDYFKIIIEEVNNG